jgi:hypothetical protein
MEVVQATLAAGSAWRGTQWNSTKAAKELRRLTGVSVVSAEFREYNDAFLFSLALVNGLEIVKLELSGPAGEAAFSLAEVWSRELQGETTDEKHGKKNVQLAGDHAMSDAGSDAGDEPDSAAKLPWEQEEVYLPEELQTCLKRVLAGTKLALGPILAEVPVFYGVKQKAEENNHGQDSKSPGDKWLRALQQRLLNLARLQAVEYAYLQGLQEDSQEACILGQQVWYYIMETEQLVLKERKRRSIPGTVVETDNTLFQKDDLQRQKEAQLVNQAGTVSQVPPRREMSCFPIPPGSKGFKFKG